MKSNLKNKQKISIMQGHLKYYYQNDAPLFTAKDKNCNLILLFMRTIQTPIIKYKKYNKIICVPISKNLNNILKIILDPHLLQVNLFSNQNKRNFCKYLYFFKNAKKKLRNKYLIQRMLIQSSLLFKNHRYQLFKKLSYHWFQVRKEKYISIIEKMIHALIGRMKSIYITNITNDKENQSSKLKLHRHQSQAISCQFRASKPNNQQVSGRQNKKIIKIIAQNQ